jgi:hypothetical protein
MDFEEAEKIPGMIEPVERELLFNLSSSIGFLPGESIIEFGTFFGRSTNCIAQGMTTNKNRQPDNLFFAYDSFKCVNNGGFFAPYVIGFAKNNGTAHLIKEDGTGLDFKPVFEHYLKKYIDSGVVKTVQAELTASEPPRGDIAMMHIDSPKFYDELKIITFRFFPRMRAGSIIVFQDFFYHWSATLIAAVVAMVNRGMIRINSSAASSLVAEVLKRPTLEDATEIDLLLTDEKQIPQLLQNAIVQCSNIPLDRREIFLPRLYLAKFQHLWEAERYDEAAQEIATFFNSGNTLNEAVVNDFMEMVGKGFSIRRLYARDHNGH